MKYDITFLLILLIYFFICLLYSVINIKFHGFQRGLFKFILTFFVPIVGFILLAAFYISDRMSKKPDTEISEYFKSIYSKKLVYHEDPIDFEKEINTIPIYDALKFNDNKAKRAYIIHIIKKNFYGHIKGLKKALKSSDTETSHYAAAALMEIKDQFEINIDNLRCKYEENKESTEAAENYADAISKYLKSGIAENGEYYDYLHIYSSILENILKKENDLHYYEEKIYADIKLGDRTNAYIWCNKFLKAYPSLENPYLALLKYYYFIKDYKSFYEVLENLKSKDIAVNKKIHEIMSFWERKKVCF